MKQYEAVMYGQYNFQVHKTKRVNKVCAFLRNKLNTSLELIDGVTYNGDDIMNLSLHLNLDFTL